MQQTVLHLEGFNSRHDSRLLRSKLSAISGVRHIRCVHSTHSVIVTHDPAQASVELILWAVRVTGRPATVLHHNIKRQRWSWQAMAALLLAGVVLLCHWTGVPRWLEMTALLAAVGSAVWSFLSLGRERLHMSEKQTNNEWSNHEKSDIGDGHLVDGRWRCDACVRPGTRL